jgi:predicted O-methyltransferase YrrM
MPDLPTRPRPNVFPLRQKHVEKIAAHIEKLTDGWRYRAWFADGDYTTDWTTGNFTRWRRMLAPWRGEPLRILEVGSWEGRSAVFFLNFFPRSTIVCIDAFNEFAEVEERFDRNLAPFGARAEKIKSVSFPALERLQAQGRMFDLVYIDAHHFFEPVKQNSIRAWPLTQAGSVIIWDDYGWGRTHPENERAKGAIDEFLREHAGEHRLLAMGYQIAIERTK